MAQKPYSGIFSSETYNCSYSKKTFITQMYFAYTWSADNTIGFAFRIHKEKIVSAILKCSGRANPKLLVQNRISSGTEYYSSIIITD